jgi:Protein of unknown function (DUF3606)
MPAKESRRRKPRYPLVNVHRPSELRAWAKYWRCTQQDIRDAVRTSGVMAVDVQDWLRINVVR